MATSMLQTNAKNPGTYTYSSQPRAVQQDKYRDETVGYGNIMYDRRVVRGNTYALHTLPASSQPDPLELQRQQEARRRALARKRAREQFRPRSPEPVEGRKHVDVQTELYLEEITDRIEEADVQCQTDAFLDRPPTPLFVPAKTGLDVATQIQEGDLFDFDLEVKPILEVLVGKTVEQSLLEVMEEEELASLRAQQCVFEENRNAELVETQRLQEQERRRREEKERRMKQQRAALLKEKETADKVASRAFAQSYLSDLVPSVFSTLSQNGFFYDPVEREVESIFMPWLINEAEKVLDEKILARTLLDGLIRDTVDKLLNPPKPPQVHETPPPDEISVTTDTLPTTSTDAGSRLSGPLPTVVETAEDGEMEEKKEGGGEAEGEAVTSAAAADDEVKEDEAPSDSVDQPVEGSESAGDQITEQESAVTMPPPAEEAGEKASEEKPPES